MVSYTLPEEEPEVLPYFVRDDFLSEAEASFFRVLRSMTGENLIVCPKVSLADIFYVSRPEKNMPYYNKINRKHVDFLLCSPNTLKPVLAIELDDTSHSRADRVERDEFVDQVFSTARLPLVHVPVQPAYNTQELGAIFRDALKGGQSTVTPVKPEDNVSNAGAEAPLCPKCGSRMVVRTAQKGSNAGQQFYGCSNYPKCRGTVLIDAPK